MSLKPYYDDGKGIVIYHGDNRKIVPLLGEFDLLLTDPPYGIGAENRKRILSRRKLATPIDYGESNWDHSKPADWVFQMLFEQTGEQIVWGGNYFGFSPSPCWFVWDKDNGSNDFADCELAWVSMERAVRKFRYRWNGMLQEDMANKEPRFHPTQKPLPLLKWCLSHVPEAKTILDPWMGSGTTLRAAKDLGLSCVGVEINEAYCEIAAKRLQQEVLAL